jgi:CRISPR-associated protein Csb1
MSENSQSLSFDLLRGAVQGSAAAIRIVTRLEPAGGSGDKVFPPTYEGGQYATELRRVGNEEIHCVLLDSVQSQANRMELALLAAYDRNEIKFPLLVVEFPPEFCDFGRITALQAPHRIFDAIFRDSLLGDKPFRESTRGKRLELSRLDNATALLELCPTALIFGAWDSTSLKPGYLGPKFERAIVSEIVGYAATQGIKTKSRIDPLQIGSNVKIYQTEDGGWTVDEDTAKKGPDGKPLIYSRKEAERDKGRPSLINHGNVTPSITDDRGEALPGGVTISHATQTTVLSLIALRRLHFPPDKAKSGLESDLAAQTLLASLALCAVTYSRSEGYDLRSRCLLIPSGPSSFEMLGTDASCVTTLSLEPSKARDIFIEASKQLNETKLEWEPGDIELTPSKELLGLVRKSRELAGKEV